MPKECGRKVAELLLTGKADTPAIRREILKAIDDCHRRVTSKMATGVVKDSQLQIRRMPRQERQEFLAECFWATTMLGPEAERVNLEVMGAFPQLGDG